MKKLRSKNNSCGLQCPVSRTPDTERWNIMDLAWYLLFLARDSI